MALAVPLEIVAAVALAGFATVLVAVPRGGPAHAFLAGHLALVAFSFLAAALLPASRLAAVGSVLAPAFLFYFIGVWPERNALNRPAALVAVFVPAVALSLWIALVGLPPGTGFLRAAAVSVFGATVAVAVLVAALRAPAHSRARFLFPALVVLAVPTLAVGLRQAVHAAATLAGRPTFAPDVVAVASAVHLATLVLGALAVFLFARRHEETRRLLRFGAVLALVLAMPAKLAEVPYFLGATTPPDVSPFLPAIRAESALRALVFGVLVSFAVLRDGLLGLPAAHRRAGARVLVAAGFATAAVVALEVADALGAPMPGAVELAVLVVALAVSQGFRSLLDAVARFAYGLDAPVAEGPLVAGAVVSDRYRIERLLGRGGGGRAFLARDATLGREVVLKEVLFDDAAAGLREAQLAARVRHPRVVAIHDVVPRAGSVLILTEHVPGGSLAERLGGEPLAAGEGDRIVEEVLEGLAAVHAAGVVHGDLKAGNVLLDAHGAKIGDFGIARAEDATVASPSEAFAGTPGSMAPEQARGLPPTQASDVYSAGVLARRLVGDDPRFAGVLARATDPEPARRFADAAAMLEAWRQAR